MFTIFHRGGDMDNDNDVEDDHNDDDLRMVIDDDDDDDDDDLNDNIHLANLSLGW